MNQIYLNLECNSLGFRGAWMGKGESLCYSMIWDENGNYSVLVSVSSKSRQGDIGLILIKDADRSTWFLKSLLFRRWMFYYKRQPFK